MTYINDIFINLNNDYFEFFEWNKKDAIIHVKKIPIIKINNKMFNDILNHNITLDKEFINKYFNKALLYSNNNKYNYLVFTNGINACAVNINDKGNILKKSSLIFEDEENIVLCAKEISTQKINYKIKKNNNFNNLTRNEKEKKNFILKNLKKIGINKLKYLYFDCFNKNEDNKTKIINIISKELKNNNLDVYKKSLNLFSLIYQKNK